MPEDVANDLMLRGFALGAQAQSSRMANSLRLQELK
jgi:hypothetical protein